MAFLITGGTGYIGSHTVVELLKLNKECIILDNLSNSDRSVIDRIKKITSKNVEFFEGDVLDSSILDQIFNEYNIDTVIHFAGLKAVNESIEKPLEYYKVNVGGTLNLLQSMKKNNVKKIVFSSTATVYGMKNTPPLTENLPLEAINPYGRSKLMVEKILKDTADSDNEWRIVVLRYFNPIGAHESGLIGEKPNGIPNNLMPYITQVASNKLECLNVFGNDYDTVDGTGVRDFIHVCDLAAGHVKASEYLNHTSESYDVFNLGTGKGTSVLELIHAFEKVNDLKINHKIAERRPGDVASSFANVSKANTILNWHANKTIEDMCEDSWHWESNQQNL